MSLTGKFDIASFNLHIKFPEFSGPVLACVAVVSYDRRNMFSTVRALKAGRLSSHCTWTCSYLSCKDPSHSTFTSQLFPLWTVSSWKLFKVCIQSALLSLLVEKVSPFPLDFGCTFPLSALLWHFQPHALWHFLDVTLLLCLFISVSGTMLCPMWSLHPCRDCHTSLFSVAQ